MHGDMIVSEGEMYVFFPLLWSSATIPHNRTFASTHPIEGDAWWWSRRKGAHERIFVQARLQHLAMVIHALGFVLRGVSVVCCGDGGVDVAGGEDG